MRTFLQAFLVVILGAAPARAADAGPPAIDTRTALLAEDVDALTPWRAYVAQAGPLVLGAGGATEAGHGWGAREPFVVLAVEGPIVRLVGEGHIRAVVGVRAEALGRVPVRRVVLAESPTAAGATGEPKGTFVELAAGARVIVERAEGGAAYVVSDSVPAMGWVREADLGVTWRPTPFPGSFVPDLAWADEGYEPRPLRRAPGGAELASVFGGGLRARGPVTDGWRLVEWRYEAERVVGWIEAAKVRAQRPEEEGAAVEALTPSGLGGAFVALEPGLWILPPGSSGDAAPFARVLASTYVGLVRDDGRWVDVRFESPWGLLPGRVDCARRAAPVGREAIVVRCLGAEAVSP